MGWYWLAWKRSRECVDAVLVGCVCIHSIQPLLDCSAAEIVFVVAG